jgi:hypothetical protein
MVTRVPSGHGDVFEDGCTSKAIYAATAVFASHPLCSALSEGWRKIRRPAANSALERLTHWERTTHDLSAGYGGFRRGFVALIAAIA